MATIHHRLNPKGPRDFLDLRVNCKLSFSLSVIIRSVTANEKMLKHKMIRKRLIAICTFPIVWHLDFIQIHQEIQMAGWVWKFANQTLDIMIIRTILWKSAKKTQHCTAWGTQFDGRSSVFTSPESMSNQNVPQSGLNPENNLAT